MSGGGGYGGGGGGYGGGTGGYGGAGGYGGGTGNQPNPFRQAAPVAPFLGPSFNLPVGSFAGGDRPNIVPNIPFRGLRHGEIGVQKYRGAAVLYDGTDERDDDQQKLVWDRLTELLEKELGIKDNHIWVHETTKRLLLQLPMPSLGLPSIFFAPSNSQEDAVLAIKTLYQEVGRIRNLGQRFEQGLPVHEGEVREVLPIGMINRVGNAETHHFNLTNSAVRMLLTAPLTVRLGDPPNTFPWIIPQDPTFVRSNNYLENGQALADRPRRPYNIVYTPGSAPMPANWSTLHMGTFQRDQNGHPIDQNGRKVDFDGRIIE